MRRQPNSQGQGEQHVSESAQSQHHCKIATVAATRQRNEHLRDRCGKVRGPSWEAPKCGVPLADCSRLLEPTNSALAHAPVRAEEPNDVDGGHHPNRTIVDAHFWPNTRLSV
jgi:hypothetical protein